MFDLRKQEELVSIFDRLKELLRKYEDKFVVTFNLEGRYELWTRKEVIINGRKRDSTFFVGLIIQSSYVGFYYMPVYTNPEVQEFFSQNLVKLLKGKSCFHIKTIDEALEKDISDALSKGFELYVQRGWV